VEDYAEMRERVKVDVFSGRPLPEAPYYNPTYTLLKIATGLPLLAVFVRISPSASLPLLSLSLRVYLSLFLSVGVVCCCPFL